MSLIPALELSSLPGKGRVLDMLFGPCDVLIRYLCALSHNEKYDSYWPIYRNSQKLLLDFLLSAELEASSGSHWTLRFPRLFAAHPRLGAPKPSQPGNFPSIQQQNKVSSSAAEQLGYWNESTKKRFLVFATWCCQWKISRCDNENMKVRIERDIKKERSGGI